MPFHCSTMTFDDAPRPRTKRPSLRSAIAAADCASSAGPRVKTLTMPDTSRSRGLCAYLNLPDGAAGTATIQSGTSFLRPVREGYVEATSTPLSVGRNVIAVETNVADARGRAVAHVVQSQAVLR